MSTPLENVLNAAREIACMKYLWMGKNYHIMNLYI